MDIYEQAVLEYISAPLWRFVNPQMALPGDSCPDFVVLDFKLATIYIVEVTTASNIKSHLEKINQREQRWYQPLRMLVKTHRETPLNLWKYRTAFFVREDVYANAKSALGNCEDVSVLSVENAFQGWKWRWGEEEMNPLEIS